MAQALYTLPGKELQRQKAHVTRWAIPGPRSVTETTVFCQNERCNGWIVLLSWEASSASKNSAKKCHLYTLFILLFGRQLQLLLPNVCFLLCVGAYSAFAPQHLRLLRRYISRLLPNPRAASRSVHNRAAYMACRSVFSASSSNLCTRLAVGTNRINFKNVLIYSSVHIHASYWTLG